MSWALAGAGATLSAGTGAEERATVKRFLPPERESPATVWAVGDGADGSRDARAVAGRIGAGDPDRFLYLGDVYPRGTAKDFRRHYAPVYGRFDRIAAPTPGNHEWPNRYRGYYPYWRSAKGDRAPAWYASRVAGWQLLSLNSEAPHASDSPQLAWLRKKLLLSPEFGSCRIAFWHRPRYSAGEGEGDQPDVEPFWRALQHRSRIVLAGHDHNMQRHRSRRGIVQFVAGSGGHKPLEVKRTDPRLDFARAGVDGALRLRLRGRRARFAFVSAKGKILDSGSLRCRRAVGEYEYSGP